jgi:hypothetical protein
MHDLRTREVRDRPCHTQEALRTPAREPVELRELDRAPRGGVLLMHDTLPWSVEAFPMILDEIERRNLALVARGQAPYELVGMERFYEPLVRERERPRAPRRGTRGRAR